MDLEIAVIRRQLRYCPADPVSNHSKLTLPKHTREERTERQSPDTVYSYTALLDASQSVALLGFLGNPYTLL